MHRSLSATLAAALVAVTFAGPVSAAASETTIAQAQPSRSAIAGRVVDQKGAAVGGATVSAQGGGGTFGTTSGGDGRFTLSVPPGVYTVVVSKGGFQQAQSDDVTVAPDARLDLTLALSEANLSTLRVIGRTSANAAGRTPININSVSVATLPQQEIETRVQPNLTELVGELPGVFANRDTTGRTPNNGFIVRGSAVETKVAINGHGVSSGVFGTWNSNYTNADVFDQVEVLKGAGLYGPNAGETAVGIVNLRTRSIAAGNFRDVKIGYDGFGGSNYSITANQHLLHDRLGIVAVRTLYGYNGPTEGLIANRIGPTPLSGTALTPLQTGPALIGWQGDLSNRFTTQAELFKARYDLSPVTSITGEFLGSHGKYQPQGGSYAIYDGKQTVPTCLNPARPNTGAAGTPSAAGATPVFGTTGCGVTSIYNAPTAIGQIGQTVDMYDWFPNSELAYNEPQFDFELKTSRGNDTFFLRPYSALINRFINGQYENYQPGYQNTGWYAVSSASNCVIPYVVGTNGAGTLAQSLGSANAKGPCFVAGQGGLGSLPYVAPGGAPVPTVFGYQSTSAPNCGTPGKPNVTRSGLPVCYTTGLNQQANGQLGFSTPFSQPEVDRLRGTTFQWIHPVRDNTYSFSVDYSSDDTYKQSNDTTLPPAGCNAVLGSGVSNSGTNAQPACRINGLPFINIPQIGLQLPPTQTRKTDYSLTGQFQLRPDLSVGLGDYLTVQQIATQVVPASVIAGNGGTSNVVANGILQSYTRTKFHDDPHLAIEYRPSRDVAVRATAGSGTTLPYAGIFAGFPRSSGVSGSNVFAITQPNAQIQPETTVAYDLGADIRQSDGGVLSIDAFDNTTHNVFISQNTVIPAIPGIPNTNASTTYVSSQTTNGPIQRNYGLEISTRKVARLGWGYNLSLTEERAFLDQLPIGYYATPITAATTLTGTTTGADYYLPGTGYLPAGSPIPAGGLTLPAGTLQYAFRGGINGKQLDGTVTGSAIPYTKARGELDFAGERDFLFSLGASYYGANNSWRDTALTLFNASIRDSIGPFGLQLSIENLFNTSTGWCCGATINAFGPVPVGAEQLPNGQVVYAGAFGPTTRPNSVQVILPRNVHFELTRRF